MSEMIERVAKVIFSAEEKGLQQYGGALDGLQEEPTEPLYHMMARAAIQAMRESTEAMIRAGEFQICGVGTPGDRAIASYKAMIDKALE